MRYLFIFSFLMSQCLATVPSYAGDLDNGDNSITTTEAIAPQLPPSDPMRVQSGARNQATSDDGLVATPAGAAKYAEDDSVGSLEDSASELPGCKEKDSLNTQIARIQSSIGEVSDSAEKSRLIGQKNSKYTELDAAKEKCDAETKDWNKKKVLADKEKKKGKEKAGLEKEKNACMAKNNYYKGQNSAGDVNFYDWEPSDDGKSGKCKNRYKEALNDESDCRNANIHDGSLKGKDCKKVLQAVKNAQAQTRAMSDVTNGATSIGIMLGQNAAQSGTQQATTAGAQKTYQIMALAQAAKAMSDISSASQLNSAASTADAATKNMEAARKEISTACGKDQKSRHG